LLAVAAVAKVMLVVTVAVVVAQVDIKLVQQH
jgi:hypothetical protein